MQARFCFAVAVFVAMTWATVAFTTAQETGKSDSPEIKALLKERRDVLKKRVEALRAVVDSGIGPSFEPFDRLVAAVDQLLLAELQLANSREQRVKLTRERLDNMRELEKLVKSQFDQGIAPTGEMLWATAARLQAEIDLLREQR